jgi:hypothetical protein
VVVVGTSRYACPLIIFFQKRVDRCGQWYFIRMIGRIHLLGFSRGNPEKRCGETLNVANRIRRRTNLCRANEINLHFKLIIL